jgi:hypothetical protein
VVTPVVHQVDWMNLWSWIFQKCDRALIGIDYFTSRVDDLNLDGTAFLGIDERAHEKSDMKDLDFTLPNGITNAPRCWRHHVLRPDNRRSVRLDGEDIFTRFKDGVSRATFVGMCRSPASISFTLSWMAGLRLKPPLSSISIRPPAGMH